MTSSFQSPSTTPSVVGGQSQALKRLPAWRIWAPLLCQTAIIIAAPAQPFYTQLTGKTVVLQTVPVDPYDPIRGYSQTLSYDVSRLENLRRLPGGQEIVKQQPTHVYVILEKPAAAESIPPKPWKPVRVSTSRPTSLPANQIALKGKPTGDSINYGLETYYMPEAQRNEINSDISSSGRQQQSVVVEVKVDASGDAVPISFWVRQRNYRF